MKVFGKIVCLMCIIIAAVFLKEGLKEDAIIMLLLSILFKIQSSKEDL